MKLIFLHIVSHRTFCLLTTTFTNGWLKKISDSLMSVNVAKNNDIKVKEIGQKQKQENKNKHVLYRRIQQALIALFFFNGYFCFVKKKIKRNV